MSTHDSDAAGNRDVVAEGNAIKMELTTVKEQSKDKAEKKHLISFPSLAQSSIPNFSASKILLNRINVRYVPDFYYIMDRCQHLFALAKHDKSIKRNEALNIHSFTLYLAYALMYVYLDTINSIDGSNADVEDVLTFLRGAGFNSNTFPIIASSWIDGLGKFIDSSIKRSFVPYLPEVVDAGDYFDNYFLSEDTGHLLPNFRALFATITLFAEPPAIGLPPNHRSRNVRLGADLTGVSLAFAGTLESRRNVYRIPGLARIAVKVNDDQLPMLLSTTLLQAAWPSNLHRYMMLDVNVLRYLKEATSDLFLYIETCAYTNCNPIGTSLTMIPLISDPTRQEIIQAIDIAAVIAQGNAAAVPHIHIYSGFDFASRVKTRTEIINGHVDIAYQTPLVRIIEDAESVKLAGHVHVNPQDAWYALEHEFQTPVVTLPEAQAYFHKID